MKESWELAEDFWGKYTDNEPVAWIFVLDGCRNVTLDEDASDETRHNGIPLYTHQAKTLTDEEILQVANEIPNLPGDWADHIVFARALLKKDGEK